jgi:mRNA interferase HigB
MQVNNLKVLVDAKAKYPNSRTGIDNWLALTQAASWAKHTDIKKTFSSASYIPTNQYCFNISGNTYRLLTIVSFSAKTVFIVNFMTHGEYDKKTLRTKK